MTSFQSKENADNLVDICSRFIFDKHGITVSRPQMHGLVTQIIQYITSQPTLSQLALEEKNKRVLVLVRNFILKQQPVQPPQPPKIEQNEQPDRDESKEEEQSEDTFFAKLEKLEIQRKTPIIQQAQNDPGQPIPVSVNVPPPQVLPPQQTTIIMDSSAKKKNCVSIFVESSKRMWMYEPKRSSFIWNGTLPTGIDVSNTRVVSVVVPTVHASIIRLKIRGVGDQESTVLLQPSHVHQLWSYFVPFHESLSYVRPVSTPWTVTLCDEGENELRIGHDCWAIRSKAVKKNDFTTTCLLFIEPYEHNGTIEQSFKKNDVIRIESGDDKKCMCQVINVHRDALEVDETPTVDGMIFNMNQQVCIVLESLLTESIK